jgi:hypothetical protein
MASSTLLLKNVDCYARWMRQHRIRSPARKLPMAVFLRVMALSKKLAKAEELPRHADTVIDLSGHIVIPGMVNTHHHLFQNLTRVVPAAQNAPLFGWLQTLYPIWRHLGPDHIYWSTALGLAELALSGCTTSSDHLYIYPNGSRLDDSLAAGKSHWGAVSWHPWQHEHWRITRRFAAGLSDRVRSCDSGGLSASC